MAAFNTYLVANSAISAPFRAWGSAVDASFTTLGWVRTSDTGQVDWGTVASTGTTNAAYGYSIFRMADSLQSSYPVFIKVEYGSGGTPQTACLWIQVGTGSNGTGTLTGAITGRYQLYCANAEITNLPCYFSGSTNRYCGVFWPTNNQSYNYMMISIERTHNSSGADTGDGLLFFVHAYNIGPYSQYIPWAGTAPAAYANWNCNIPTTVTPATSGAYKNTVAVYPIKAWTPGESGPSSNIFFYLKKDLTPSVPPLLNTIPVTLFDGAVTGTYLPVYFYSPENLFAVSASNRGTSGGNVSLLLRYD